MKTISWEDFEKVELRVGTIVDVQDFPEARKPSSRGGSWRLSFMRKSAEVTKNSKSQISNNKQITMTEIVRASLGLPTLRVGHQFQNPKPLNHLG